MYKHKSVLLNEAIEFLNIKKDGVYVDATLGGGGHSLEIVKKLTSGHLYCFDQDQFATNYAKDVLKGYEDKYTIIESNFVNLASNLASLNIKGIDGILYDLGVSSFQFDIGERGFSYKNDAILDMRMDSSASLTAYEIINNYSYEDLVKIFFKYGEEPFSKQIARKIEKERQSKPIKTTFDLVDIIKKSLPTKILNKKGHPAKQIFQALRIAVNDELQVFEKSLYQALELLNKNGRAVVITFHSLEDRICKSIFKEKTSINIPKNLPIIHSESLEFNLITKKAYLPSEEELEGNNRAHSAKMRVISKN